MTIQREYMQKIIKDEDSRIPIPVLDKTIMACESCAKVFNRTSSGLRKYIKHYLADHLKPKVFILWHIDQCEYVEHKELMGIFTTKTLAEQAKKKIKSKIPYEEKEFEIKPVIMDTTF